MLDVTSNGSICRQANRHVMVASVLATCTWNSGAVAVSLQAFDEVLPAGGAVNAAVRLPPLRMAEQVNAQWIDVAQA
jgi:hypothetical protein